MDRLFRWKRAGDQCRTAFCAVSLSRLPNIYEVFPEERASPRAIGEDEARQVFPDMSRQKLFQFNDLEIWKEGDRFFATYDAGSHQVIWRKDEITGEEAELARRGPTDMLFALQKRLSEAGIDPYISNFERD